MTTTTLDLSSARHARDGLATPRRADGRCRLPARPGRVRPPPRVEPLGPASLFAFLTVELHLSRSAAFWRLSAARLVQRFPAVIEPLRDGRLCLSTTAELAKVLSEENLVEVLPRYFHLSAREAAEVTAALLPREQPPLRTVVTNVKLERRSVVMTAAPPDWAADPAPATTRTLDAVLTSEPLARPARVTAPRDDIEPLTSDLRRLHITVGKQVLAKIAAARNGLSHALPGATTEQVIEAALDLLLEKQARARGLVKRPRAAPSPSPTVSPSPNPTTAQPSAPTEPPPHRRDGPRGAIPAPVRRAAWERDGGRCAWPLDGGGRCGSTQRLELDHVVPWALGGESTLDNLRLACAAHNRVAARQAFGARCVARYAVARHAVRGRDQGGVLP